MKKPIPFGKYHLLERINVGGMAEVFRAKAYGVEGFERLVAVKRILPNIAEDIEFITMFIDEAKIAVQLNHANIAQIFDLGVADGAHYIALEHVLGRDLRAIFDRCRQRAEPMPVAQACFVVMKTCEGLDYAHNKRDQSGQEMHLVHRDVSPQNVLVSFEGDVKIIDFGIAKAAGRGGNTQAGILKGKFGYMSPEQVRGLPIDRRSDIFSTGIVLYELLTDERLFVGESDFSTLEKVRNVEILPPTTYNRKIPDELERIVLKALAKDVEDRYQHAIDLHDELQAFVYTAGEFYSRKDLTAWMKKTFAKEIDDETARLDEYRKIGPPESRRDAGRASVVPVAGGTGRRPTLPAAPPPLPPEIAAANGRAQTAPRRPDARELARGVAMGDGAALEWDDEELETQIYDNAPGEPPTPPSAPQAAMRAVEGSPLPVPVALQAVSPVVGGAGAAPRGLSGTFSPAMVPAHAIAASGVVGAVRRPAVVTGTARAVAVPPRQRSPLLVVGGLAVTAVIGLAVVAVGRHTKPSTPTAVPAAAPVEPIVTQPGALPSEAQVFHDTGFDVITDPPGARVRLDGRFLEQPTPCTVRNVPSGRHVLEFDPPPGFQPKTTEVTAEDGKAALVSVKLDALDVMGTFRSEPPGAHVYLSHDSTRESLGAAPVTRKLDPRNHYTVAFERDGYATTTRAVEIGRDPEVTIVAVLEKDKGRTSPRSEPREPSVSPPRAELPTPRARPPEVVPPPRSPPEEEPVARKGDPGFLSIGTKPPCKIFIDGRDSGLVTPQRGINVPAGTHKVVLINNEFGIREPYTVPVKAGETTKLVYDYSDRIHR